MFARLTAVLPVVLVATIVGASIVPRCESPGHGSGSGSGSSGSGSGSSGSGSGSSGSGSGSSGSGSSDSGSGSSGTCTTGPVRCCNQNSKVHSRDLLGGLLDGLGATLEGLLVGDCSPLLGGVQCSGTTVCCEDNSEDTLISIGCLPIIL